MDKQFVEANIEEPQEIDVPHASDNINSEKTGITILTNREHKKTPNYIVPPYFITPLMSYNEERENNLVSLRRNPPLREHYNTYLSSVRHGDAKFQLYRETIRDDNKPNPRKYSLNGQFYDSMNRPCPVPYLPKITEKFPRMSPKKK
ncbi:uncharacterized protein LOC119685939 [Teleopsis dalmanni]|uniref:uncharacterized protein LOC119685903 n=1 Tax=Teleopsis dalmanni TaxID=139649 RepID=UPI0018CCA69A|nr:uncharacterized protein LOC119685903 [Teleopsis dalmanni]XP_037956281.1 uncharacterized protein LOC119685939 [Teleopsis dalmanni]